MAENIQGENSAQSGNAGHRTIKLTPMNVQTPKEESVGTSTVKVGKMTPPKPQNPISPAAFAGDLEKTQAIPIKKLKPVPSAQPVSSPFLKKAGPGTTQTLSPKAPDTSTKGIPLSGVASVPKPETALTVWAPKISVTYNPASTWLISCASVSSPAAK